jgi:hypothetical protein
MKSLSFRLSRALAGGRADRGAPDSREAVLERLLRKRAAAHQAGLEDQERLLRNQIIWSLPMRAANRQSGAGEGASCLRDQARHYRELLAGNCDPQTAASLAMMAEECEAEAERIENPGACSALLESP